MEQKSVRGGVDNATPRHGDVEYGAAARDWGAQGFHLVALKGAALAELMGSIAMNNWLATVALMGFAEAARLANTPASRSEHAARASPKGSLRLLCADREEVMEFVHIKGCPSQTSTKSLVSWTEGVLGGVCP